VSENLNNSALPVCRDDYEGHLYRAIFPYSVIEQGSLPESDIAEPTGYDMAILDGYYSPDLICRIPDPKGKGADRIFLGFPFAFDIGGQDHPYPDSVPACDEADTLYRAAFAFPANRKNSELPVLLPLHEDALISPEWVPITDEDVDEFDDYLAISDMKAICQKKISDDPERHGIFLVEKDPADMGFDPFERISDEVQSNDIDSQIAIYRETIEAMPRELRKCASSASDLIHMIEWGEDIREMRSAADDIQGDPYVRDVLSPRLALRLIEDADLFDVGRDEIFTLENIVSFAIEGGLGEEELGDIAVRLSGVYSNTQKTIYGLFAIASLRIAKALHLLHEERGGISDDFVEFTDSIERAIADGRISVRVQSIRDNMRTPNALAFYQNDTNAIVFPQIISGTSPSAYFESIVHECYHAFQDMNHRITTTLGLEEEAYTRATRAALLMDSVRDFHTNPLIQIAESENIEFADMLFESSLRTMECHGVPREIIERTRDFKAVSNEAQMNWRHAVESNLLLGTVYDEAALFADFYRLANYETILSNYGNQSMLSLGYEYDSCVDFAGAKACNERFLSAFESHEPGYRVFPETAEGASEARDFLFSESYIMASVFYADRQLWGEMNFDEPFDRESAMDALLMSAKQFDGI